MSLKEKLERLRNEKDLTQKEVASKLGLHLNTYARVERGRNKPSAAIISKLAKFYNLDESYFSDDENTKPRCDGSSVTDTSDEFKNMDFQCSSLAVELQYAGKSISYDDIIKGVRSKINGNINNLSIYIKPEENRVYYVADQVTGNFGI